jgi:hypothetical protein
MKEKSCETVNRFLEISETGAATAKTNAEGLLKSLLRPLFYKNFSEH